jgi:hypothetical protein
MQCRCRYGHLIGCYMTYSILPAGHFQHYECPISLRSTLPEKCQAQSGSPMLHSPIGALLKLTHKYTKPRRWQHPDK